MGSYIGYKNVFTDGTVTASSGTIADGIDYLLYDSWTPTTSPATVTVDCGSATKCNYIAIAGHTLGTKNVTLTVHSDDNAGFSSATLHATITPSTDGTIFVYFTGATERYWKLTFTWSGSAPSVGHMNLGEALEVDFSPSGFINPIFSRNTEYINMLNQGGQFLGRSVLRQGLSFSLTTVLLPMSWFDTYFEDLLDATEVNPFFIQWDSVSHPNDNVFCWTVESPRPSVQGPTHASFALNCEAVR